MIPCTLVLVTTICILYLYHYFTRNFNYWTSKNVKGPKPILLFGNIKDIALRRKPKGMLYKEIYNQYPKEKVVGFYQMTSPALLLRDLDIIKQVMVKDFNKFPDRGIYFSTEGLGQNIFHSNADTWKFLRNRFAAVFTPSKLKTIFQLLDEHGKKLISFVEDITEKQQEQDVYEVVFKYTVATSLVAIFGWHIDIFNDNTEWFEVFDKNLNNCQLQEIDSLFPGFLEYSKGTVISEKVRNICHHIVKTCLNEEQVKKCDIFNVKDVLINLKEEYKENETDNKVHNLLAGQVWVFYTAGYLNNALTLTNALYQLARNPDVQDKLRNEIDEVLQSHNGILTNETFKKMKYLEMVFEETLRIQPMTHALLRSASQNVKLEGTKITIDKGTLVVISPYSIHHDKKYYPEPERFKPERFSSGSGMNRHPCAFLSFGAGQRSCLGSQLARIQFGICLSKLIQHFRVEATENTCESITYDRHHMLLKPDQRIRLKFVPRKK